MKKLTKKDILTKYESCDSNHVMYLCNFTSEIDRDLGKKFKKYLQEESIYSEKYNVSFNTISSFGKFFTDGYCYPMYTFRYMVLEDFLTKQGIE